LTVFSRLSEIATLVNIVSVVLRQPQPSTAVREREWAICKVRGHKGIFAILWISSFGPPIMSILNDHTSWISQKGPSLWSRERHSLPTSWLPYLSVFWPISFENKPYAKECTPLARGFGLPLCPKQWCVAGFASEGVDLVR